MSNEKLDNLILKITNRRIYWRNKSIKKGEYIIYKSPFLKDISDNETIHSSLILGVARLFSPSENAVSSFIITPEQEEKLVYGDIIEEYYLGFSNIYQVEKEGDKLYLKFINSSLNNNNNFQEINTLSKNMKGMFIAL